MSWVITPSFYGFIADADAKDYLVRVHAAEGQTLEPEVCLAIEAFIVGCKADGIWPAIKASCILAGARTLTGALVPLVGAPPTLFGTEAGWNYNRETGLQGTPESANYFDTNRANNADPQDSKHVAVYASSVNTNINNAPYLLADPGGNGRTALGRVGGVTAAFSISGTNTGGNIGSTTLAPGFAGASRPNSSTINARYIDTSGQKSTSISLSSNTSSSQSIAANYNYLTSYSNARLAFYSIGESLDLALLDARVTTLINAFDAAI
jgi:hypothetical protein